jgi:hypothetical protein
MQKPTKPPDAEPVAYSQLEQRRRLLDDETEISPVYPRLPSSSPWASDPVPAEPLIDRSEDSNNFQPEDE